jgi:hypothetical protein
VTIKQARAALSHSVSLASPAKHLDRLVAELAEPFEAAREGRLHHQRGDRNRRRLPGAGRPQTLTLPDRVLCALAWLRIALPHQALAAIYGVDRSTVSGAIRQIRPLLANRGFATPSGQRLHTLTDVLAYAAVEGLPIRLDGTEIPGSPAEGQPTRSAGVRVRQESRTRSRPPSPPTPTAGRCGPGQSDPDACMTKPP